MSHWRKRRCVWRTTWALMCVSWIKYMSHTEYATKMIMNISDSLHCWSAQRRLAREGACEERLERLCTWIKSLVSFSTCHRDEMIMHLAIAYAVSQRNTFANHHREVNEIANARRSSTRNARWEWRTAWTLRCLNWITYRTFNVRLRWDDKEYSDSLRYWSAKYVRSSSSRS